MSTEDQNKVVVTLHKGVDVDRFIEEMNSVGNTSQFVPNRAVEVYNLKPESLRNVDFVMTKAEMDKLKNDPRVLHCRWGTKAENGIGIKHASLDSSRTYTRTTSFASGNVDMNWGLAQTSSRTNLFSTSSISYQFPYTLSGNGVDFVIQDSGLQVDHPEFQDEYGNSRVQQINWFTATGQSGSMPTNFYTDEDGHGTNVCGIAAGKTYGFAKNAHIYVMNILGVNASSTLSPSQTFALLRIWHQNKPPTSTGFKRPTIVNMSWGYYTRPSYVTDGNYRGTIWTASGAQPAYGIINYGNDTMPGVDLATEADAEDAMDAGVILVGAAGNDAYKMDVQGGIDWDNYCYNFFGDLLYYHRGGTPTRMVRAIKVGCIDLQYTPTERKAAFSNTGPAIDVWAPGSRIAGPASNITDLGSYPVAAYPYNAAYKCCKVSGTSQASPQVAGLLACFLESRPYATIDECREFIVSNATTGRLTSTGSGYTDYYSLQGAGNRYLYNPFNGTNVTQTSNLSGTIYGKI